MEAGRGGVEADAVWATAPHVVLGVAEDHVVSRASQTCAVSGLSLESVCPMKSDL